MLYRYIPYTAIYRIIVIDRKALNLSFVDRPTEARWKVSVCCNRNMDFLPAVPPAAAKLAEEIQSCIMPAGRGVHFIDLFETKPGSFTVSEINTACSLCIHQSKATHANHPQANLALHLARAYVACLSA